MLMELKLMWSHYRTTETGIFMIEGKFKLREEPPPLIENLLDTHGSYACSTFV